MINEKARIAWQEYLSVNPSTRDIAWIFFCNDQEGINVLAWEEMKSWKNKKNEDIIMPVLYCRNPRWVRDEAWEILSKRDPTEKQLGSITTHLKANDPIVEDIIARYGKNEAYLLQRAKEAIQV